MSWTEERIERLKTMWHDGSTASHIADELGGVSRNAVIGKAHRLGLQSRPSPVKATETAAADEQPQSAAPQPAPIMEARPAPAPEPAAEPAAPADTSPNAAPAPPAEPAPLIRSIGPGGYLRQAPGEQQSPIPPAPPRRLVPATPSPEIAD